MFFENETNRLLKKFFSDPFFGFGDFEGSCSDKMEKDENQDGRWGPDVRYYGIVMTVGPDGRPIVREYGNAQPTGRLQGGRPRLETDETRQPLADTIVDEKEKRVKIITEMPGVEKRDIKIAVEGKHVEISTTGGDKKYQIRAPLERRVDANSAKATYRNGILQITFNLVEGNHNKKTIRIE